MIKLFLLMDGLNLNRHDESNVLILSMHQGQTVLKGLIVVMVSVDTTIRAKYDYYLYGIDFLIFVLL